eukprot:TRINITY_DN114_c1_g1_i1.p1 TRINITY_DN114_c1_g1~~TRINITY_DN114_c1_g1_i1.p1  ORF type:complete len:445 (+),score=124.00 TRINITY_DN114_c1_g1_i1:72-1337(+)
MEGSARARADALMSQLLAPTQGPCEGRATRPGRAFYPVMTPAERAPLMVDAGADPAALRRVLDEHGVCIVTGVLSADECRLMQQLWHADLQQVVDEQSAEHGPQEVTEACRRFRGDLLAWPESNTAAIGSGRRGLPHGAFAWAARLHPSVRRVFASVFNTSPQELITGSDCIFWDTAPAGPAADDEEWLHCDQNSATGENWHMVQGVLYVWPSEGSDRSTTVIWPGSHKPQVFDRLMRDPCAVAKGASADPHYVQINHTADRELLERAVAGARRVPCPAGSLLLWNSRTVHQGWRGGPRLAMPICWEPRERRDADTLRRKLWMAAAGAPSTHSGSEGRVHPLLLRAQKGAPEGCAGRGADHGLQLPMRPTMVPWSIAPGQEAAWAAAQGALWGAGNARECAKAADAGALQQLLRPEVVAAL